MFNVLPDSFKQFIRGQYKKKRLIAWLFVIVSLQIFSLIFLTPSYIYLMYQERDLVAQNTSLNQSSQAENILKISQIFTDTNKELSVLALSVSSTSVDTLLAHLISLKGSSVTFQSISYMTSTATTSIITLRGIASSRESLLLLAKRLEADSSFEKVNLPVSNFAKDKDIDFSMTMQTHI